MSQTLLSIVSGISISAAAGYLGTLMLQKRMALTAGPLGHLALPGIALALLYGFDISLGAFPFILLGVIFIWLFALRTRVPLEALTAIIFASGVALAFLFLPLAKAEAALVGDISSVSFLQTTISFFLCLFLFLLIRRIFPRMVLISVSPDLAKTEGINIQKYNLIYLLSIGIIVALGVRLVGGLLTAALVAIPAATAKNLSRNMTEYAIFSPLFGVVSAVGGVLAYRYFLLPAGPIIILVNTFIFILSVAFRRA